MKTIVEPKDYIQKLWGKQRIRNDNSYRMMRYVLRVDYDGKVLLHNVVSGQLVVLDQDEALLVDQPPAKYCDAAKPLIEGYYLVEDQFDEHQWVVNMRRILSRLNKSDVFPSDSITHYTILPTTACNARCYYCYECDLPKMTMTEEIAKDSIRFISNHCHVGDKVTIRWFGGEPLVATHRIDQICEGLQNNGIHYSSSMTTNGYLFDEEMVSKAKTLWNLTQLMICFDGLEKNYNTIKAYVNAKDNPYQRVLRNIGLLLDQKIRVILRMNFDLGNYQDFKGLLAEVKKRFPGNNLLQVYAFPVIGEYPDSNGQIIHGSDEWFDEKIAELNDLAQDEGVFQRAKDLPSLFFAECKAGDSSSMIIGPLGQLARCTRVFEQENQIVGNVSNGQIDWESCKSWRVFSDPERCIDCSLFPSCVLIEKCPGKDRCFPKETRRQHEEAIKRQYEQWVNHKN